VPKKLSIGALSQQFPLRLIDWMIAAVASEQPRQLASADT